jgi:predicted DCC family thiol-disulfide oxidoreductase YuxK
VRDTCFYDGRCGLCRRSTRTLCRLDWLNRLEFRDMNSVPDLPVPFEAAMSGMPMRTREGRILIGYAAVRRALLQTPLGAPIAVLLYLPGLSHVGRVVYRLIAANRRRDTCAAAIAPPPSTPARPASPAP